MQDPGRRRTNPFLGYEFASQGEWDGFVAVGGGSCIDTAKAVNLLTTYPATRAACVVDDPAGGRRLVVDKAGSGTTVVWNPWAAKARAMADLGDEEWLRMLCIETANAADDRVTLASGARHEMRATIRVLPR